MTICTTCQRPIGGQSIDPLVCTDRDAISRVVCFACAAYEGAFQEPSFVFRAWVDSGDRAALLEWRWRNGR